MIISFADLIFEASKNGHKIEAGESFELNVIQKVFHLNHDVFRECSALTALFDIYNISTYYLQYAALVTEESIHYFKVMKIEGRLICHECITLSPWLAVWTI